MADHRGLPEPPDPLEYELQEARAMALGQAGRKLEKALAALEAAAAATDRERDPLLDAAADAVWELLIVRESLRFYNHQPTLEAYGVPSQVIARVGVVRKR